MPKLTAYKRHFFLQAFGGEIMLEVCDTWHRPSSERTARGDTLIWAGPLHFAFGKESRNP
jgi:hypothetical protein